MYYGIKMTKQHFQAAMEWIIYDQQHMFQRWNSNNNAYKDYGHHRYWRMGTFKNEPLESSVRLTEGWLYFFEKKVFCFLIYIRFFFHISIEIWFFFFFFNT